MDLTDAQIERKILEGKLPARFNGRALAGYGKGHACELCGKKIDASRVEYEIEHLDTEGVIRTVRLDGECFQAWLSQTDEKTAESLIPEERLL
jgi:hypothetical protein